MNENPQSIYSIAENWYARLNNLKEYSQRDDISLNKRQQCERLIWVMINRMMKITPHYLELRQKQVLSNKGSFKPGGIIFKTTFPL